MTIRGGCVCASAILLLACSPPATSYRPTPPDDIPFSVEWLAPYPDLLGVHFATPNEGWTVGDRGKTLHTTDGGNTWNPQDTGVSARLNAVRFNSKSIGWAVGDNVILRTEDGGATWSRGAVPLESFELWDVLFRTDAEGWAVGTHESEYEGIVLSTVDAGKHWSVQKRIKGGPFYAIASVPGTHTLLVGGSDGAILRSDDGHAWSLLPKPCDSDITSIGFLRSDLGAASCRYSVLFTENQGGRWVAVPTPDRHRIHGIAFADSGRLLTVDSTDAILDVGRDGRWRVMKSAVDVAGIQFMDVNHVWAVGAQGSIYRSATGGTTWELSHGFPMTAIRSFQLLSPMDGMGLSIDQSLLKTRDGGRSWLPLVSLANRKMRASYFLDANRGWAVSEGGQLLRTDSAGESWQPITTDFDALAIHFISPTTGWAVGPGRRIRATVDGGHSWSMQFVDSAHGDLRAVEFQTAARGWAVGDHGAILKTVDGGGSWREALAASGCDYFDVTFANSFVGWVGGSPGCGESNGPSLLETQDGGEHWRSVSLPRGYDGRLSYIGAAVTTHERTVTAIVYRGQDEISAIAVNDPESPTTVAVLRGNRTATAPYITRLQSVAVRPSEVELRWAASEPSASTTAVAFRRRESSTWVPITVATPIAANEFGDHVLRWNPSGQGAVPAGTELGYRITLRGAGGLEYQDVWPHTFRYKPPDLSASQVLALSILALIAAYPVACFVLLRVRPLTLFRIHEHALLNEVLLDAAAASAAAPIARAIIRATSLRFLATHPRTRFAWIQKYREGWGSLSRLSAPLRQAYFDDDRCLDAWVDRHRRRATEALVAADFVSSRALYVDVPLLVRNPSSQTTLAPPTLAALRESLPSARLTAAIVGGADSGKTVLAVQLALMALHEHGALRLFDFVSIPMVISEETIDLLETVRSRLARIANSDDVPLELARSLLRTQRVTVVVDGLTERSQATINHVADVTGQSPFHSMIVTAREFGPIASAALTYVLIEDLSPVSAEDFAVRYTEHRHPGCDVDRSWLRSAINDVSASGLRLTPLILRIVVDGREPSIHERA